MVSTSATTSATGAASSLFEPAPAKQASQQDDFLKLFVAELEHQDPLEPQKGSEFISQLATLTQVQQTAETNNHLTDLQAQQASNARTSYIGLVGHRVKVHSSELEKPPTKDSSMSFSLPRAAKDVEVHILDTNGNTVRTLKLGARGSGETAVDWDGLGEDKKKLADGKYRVEVVATDAQGNSVDATTTLSGVIDQLKFENGSATFSIGSTAISPGDILSIGT
ncbi:MAG: flagellar hook assembly protein FlgD [Myxococcota bacterium]